MAESEDQRTSLLGVSAGDSSRVTHRRASGDDARVRQFVVEAARLLEDLHFDDILLLDVRGLCDVTDYLLIASGTSPRQIRSVGSEVADLAKASGLQRFGREVDDSTTWVVLDFVDVIVHLFDPEARAHYALEMLWGDAVRVDWQRIAGGGST